MQLLLLSLCVISHVVRADIYMHNPRGSNDRGCETNENRNNGNRLFDSQNNAKGGYACQAAYPFACYLDPNNAAVRAQCNALNNDAPDDLQTNGFADRMDNGGLIVNNQPTVGGVNFATRTDRMKFVEGSQLTVEWTNQHGCGDNPKSHCDIIIQYACEDTLTDDCGLTGQGKTCGPRDGLPITNSDQDRGNAQYQNFLNPNQNININRRARDRDATETIPVSISNNVQSDPRFGRHESLRYFEQCASRERNKGLFAADQNLNGNTAQTTRQNNNANRNGLECAEESEYFPYWHPSPWKDAAILTDQIDWCAELQAESQNVKAKNFCECPTCRSAANPNSNKLIPNNEAACLAAGGTWKEAPAFGIAAPFCGKAPTSRENHLGNQVGQGSSTATAFNWTIPAQAQLGGNTCVLRIRYNISTGDDISEADPRDITIFGTNAQNGQQSSIKDRNNNEAQTYVKFLETNAKVGLAINTNQFGRTFQDRSYTFSIVARNDQNAGPCAASGKIYNLNVRGKRGNIVQVYPAVEYDFVPSELAVTVDDCVHVQWTGSDYNPARNDNDAFGGPNDPKNMNNGRADRSNIVPLDVVSNNIPAASLADDFNMFSASLDQKMRLVFLDQNINDANACLDIVALQALSKQAQQNNNLFNDNGNNFLDQDQDRDRFFKNCAKLSGQRTPYFNGGVLKAGTEGTHLYFSSRNTCFSNRDQRGFLHVLASGAIPADAGNPEKNTDGPDGGGIGAPPQAASANGVDPVPIAAGVGGTFAALIGLAGLVAYSRRSSKSSRGESSSSPMYGLKDKAMDTFSNFRQSFANFGSSAGFQGFGSPQSSPTGNNGGGGGGFFRQSMAQFTNTFRPQTQQPSSPMGGGGGSMMSAGGMGMGMSMGGGYPQSVPRSPMPPPMMMSQPNVQRATAMYDHKAGESGELSFNKGDVITVMRRDASGWWEGECNGQRGIFPANYVRVQSAGWN